MVTHNSSFRLQSKMRPQQPVSVYVKLTNIIMLIILMFNLKKRGELKKTLTSKFMQTVIVQLIVSYIAILSMVQK